MASINDKLSILANSTESADSGLSNDILNEEKKKVAAIDYKMVTFSLSGKDYAIDIMRIKEIAKAGRFTYVPNTLPFVLGVYNLRGDIIPIIDLRLFFNIQVPEREDNTLENMLIVTAGEQIFGVVVDEIDKVIGVQKSTIQPPHPLFGDINIKYIYGVVEADKRLYVLLDVEKIFGVRSPEEERELAEKAMEQMRLRQNAELAMEQKAKKPEESAGAASAAGAAPAPEAALEVKAVDREAEDFKFVTEGLKNFRKFTVNSVNEQWVKNRYKEWAAQRGNDKTQFQSEADADLFLKPFFSECSGTWWTEAFASKIESALPENAAKTIVVWNPGCGKGYESYSLACILKKRYPNAKIKIYGQDVDLLSVSNAPLMNLTDQASSDWYQPYTTRTVGGDFTFNKEIKDSIMFEYHDCVNTNNLPPIDIIFARDLISFLPETSQNALFTEFSERMKGNGIIIVGENENINLPGWTKKRSGGIELYSK